jgi:hypothetical protein
MGMGGEKRSGQVQQEAALSSWVSLQAFTTTWCGTKNWGCWG